MPIKTADAVWNGTLIEGSGHLKSQSGRLDSDYSWKARSEDTAAGPGQALTNPEELIAAAHAGCFSMALSHILTGAGFKPTRISTGASVVFEKQGEGFAITKIRLKSVAVVPGLGAEEFAKHAAAAKAGCPVSKALAAVPIELDARVESSAE